MYHVSELEEGQVFFSGFHDMTSDQVKSFAAEYDPQALHLSDANIDHGPLVASGWHTAATTMRLFLEAMPLTTDRVGAEVSGLNWLRPVMSTDRLRVKATIQSIHQSSSRRGLVILKVLLETFNQTGDLVQSMTPTMLVRSTEKDSK